MAIGPTTEVDAAGFTPDQERVLSKVLWHIVPFLLLCYIIAYLDRVNVGVAGLTMNKDLGLALIVSIGNLGGFVAPYLIGAIRQSTGSFAWALISVAASLILGAILIRIVGISLRGARTASTQAATA